MAGSTKHYIRLEEYMIHDSVGSERYIYQSTEDGYFYLDDDERWVYPPKKDELIKFELGEEFNEAVIAHILKFG